MQYARRLRKGKIKSSQTKNKLQELILVLDDVYDTFNVGGMYRIGDAVGIAKIVHCGETPVPPQPKISRASVGLDKYIKHEYQKDIVKYLLKIKTKGYRVIVLEQNNKSKKYDKVNFFQNPESRIENFKLALVAGNETFGVKQEVINIADSIVELPMYGINKSLNVVVSTGIVLYQIRNSTITLLSHPECNSLY